MNAQKRTVAAIALAATLISGVACSARASVIDCAYPKDREEIFPSDHLLDDANKISKSDTIFLGKVLSERSVPGTQKDGDWDVEETVKADLILKGLAPGKVVGLYRKRWDSAGPISPAKERSIMKEEVRVGQFFIFRTPVVENGRTTWSEDCASDNAPKRVSGAQDPLLKALLHTIELRRRTGVAYGDGHCTAFKADEVSLEKTARNTAWKAVISFLKEEGLDAKNIRQRSLPKIHIGYAGPRNSATEFFVYDDYEDRYVIAATAVDTGTRIRVLKNITRIATRSSQNPQESTIYVDSEDGIIAISDVYDYEKKAMTGSIAEASFANDRDRQAVRNCLTGE